MAIGRRRLIVFALLAAVLATVITTVAVLAADLYLHHRAERSAGLNRWGYRGPVLSKKQPGEIRVAMLGGSTVFGYGVLASESIPAFLEQRLNQAHPERRWTVVNLGFNTEGAYAFVQNLIDFGYLDYDVVILYEGYNDLLGDGAPNFSTVRQQSPVFRATGYFPILPLWLQEKALMLRTGSVAYDQASGRTVFRPTVAARASASALDAAGAVAAGLEQQFRHVSSAADNRPNDPGALGCPSPWKHYCDAEHRAVDHVLAQGKRVLVVAQPTLADGDRQPLHQAQQQALADMLRREYASNPRVAHVAIGALVDLLDLDVSFDRMHLNGVGNNIVAGALVEPVSRLVTQ